MRMGAKSVINQNFTCLGLIVLTRVDPNIISNSCVCEMDGVLKQNSASIIWVKIFFPRYFLASGAAASLMRLFAAFLTTSCCLWLWAAKADNFSLNLPPGCPMLDHSVRVICQQGWEAAATTHQLSRGSLQFCFHPTPNQLSSVWGEAHRRHGKGRPFQNKSLKGDWRNHLTFNLTDFFFFSESWANS